MKLQWYRSSHWRCSANFLEHLQLFFKNIDFVEHLRKAATDGSESDESENDNESNNEGIGTVVRKCSSN